MTKDREQELLSKKIILLLKHFCTIYDSIDHYYFVCIKLFHLKYFIMKRTCNGFKIEIVNKDNFEFYTDPVISMTFTPNSKIFCKQNKKILNVIKKYLSLEDFYYKLNKYLIDII